MGNWLQSNGWAGRQCLHFDFGAHLRAGTGLDERELQFVRDLLQTGGLLENETFHIAKKILCMAVAGHESDLLVLNGLPRHVGQAVALESLVTVRGVIHLQADAATIFARLQNNAGGDRTGRVDDEIALVQRKLATFAERTWPLIEHYRQRKAKVWTVQVGVHTVPKEMVDDTGLEPVTSSMSRKRSSQLS